MRHGRSLANDQVVDHQFTRLGVQSIRAWHPPESPKSSNRYALTVINWQRLQKSTRAIFFGLVRLLSLLPKHLGWKSSSRQSFASDGLGIGRAHRMTTTRPSGRGDAKDPDHLNWQVESVPAGCRSDGRSAEPVRSGRHGANVFAGLAR